MAIDLFFAALVVCAAPFGEAQESQRLLLEHANDDAIHGRYSSAKVGIEAAIAIDGNHAEPWYQLGLLNGQMADYRGAEQAFRHALMLDPHSAKTHCRLGQTLVAAPEVKEDWEGAVAEFRTALQIDPTYPEAESLLGLGLTHLGDRAGSIATLHHAIQLHPAQASAHLNLALVLEEQPEGQGEAIAEYRASLAAKPEAPETESLLASLLLRMGHMVEAEQAFRRALRLNPDLQEAHYGLARVLKANKRVDEAAIEFGLAADLERRRPDSTQAIRLNNNAMQIAATGDLPKAISDLQRSIVLKPDYGIAKYNLGLILADSGDLARAKEELIDAVSLMPGQATVWFDLGRVLAKMGEKRSSFEAISWAARLSPANARFTEELKELRARNPSGDTSKPLNSGHAEGNSVVDRSGKPRFGAASDTVDDRLAFARVLRGRGDLPGALGELTRALELKPNAVDARIEIAQVYTAQSRWDLASEQYRMVLAVVGDEDASGHLALGNALLQTRRITEAVEQFSKALTLEPNSKVAQAGLAEARQALTAPLR